ncbi:hypothetical protein L7F22_023697 [Adiantum nelumboides]|nr:hypothetical protein [Adiantum nelumboides]
MVDRPDDVTEEVSSSQGQQTHEVGESSRPPQTEDEIFRTQLVIAVAMFTQVMQNPRFMALLQSPPPSQSIGNKKQKSEPAKAQSQVIHTAEPMETRVHLLETMQSPNPVHNAQEQVAETPVLQAIPVQPATFQQPIVGPNGQGSDLQAMQQVFPPPSIHRGEDLSLSMKGSEMLNSPDCQQGGVEGIELHKGGIELHKGMAKDDHDSVCNKCKQRGQLICCDGKDCKITYHIDCLDPPLRDVPPNDWYCPCCACKRFFDGMHSVSKGIESIWDVNVLNDGSAAHPEGSLQIGTLRKDGSARGLGDVGQPQADYEARAVSDGVRIITATPLEKGSPNLSSPDRVYLVKYKGVAHAHNLWLAESQVFKEATKLLINYKKQVEQGKAPKLDPEWSKPFRVISKRKTMLAKLSEVFPGREDSAGVGHCIEWCIKWNNLGYEACTWELADKTPLDSAHSKKLIADYETRSAKAASCCPFENNCSVEAHSNPSMLVDYPNLSEVIDKLLSLWQKHTNSIVVNEIHQDRMRTAIGFLLCLIEKFAISKPCCVVVSPLLLSEWKAAFKKWMPNANVVVYAGSKEARKIIRRYEFYNEDGLCMAQIVLTTSDTLNLDVETLKELGFEALIIDECQRLKGTKTSKSVQHFASPYRLLLLGEPIKKNLEDYQHILQELAGGNDDMLPEDNLTLMQLKTLVSKHIVQEAKQESSSPVELWVPVKMTAFQLEQYCTLLINKCDTLVRGKRGDIASSPQELLLKLRECCNHPFLVKPGFQESLTHLSAKELLDYGIRASGKLKLLDMMLGEAKSSNKRVLIITQVPVVGASVGKVYLPGVLLDGGSGVNILPEATCKSLNLLSWDPAPFQVKMAYQRRVQPLGILRAVQISVGGLQFVANFVVLKMEESASSYPMMLGRPWLRAARVKQLWGSDAIVIKRGKKKVKLQMGAKKVIPPGFRPLHAEGLNMVSEIEEDVEDEFLISNSIVVPIFEVDAKKLIPPGFRPLHAEGLNMVAEIEEDVEDEFLRSNSIVVSIFEVDVQKIATQFQ